MKAASVLILCFMLAACASVSNISYPMADGTYRNQRTLSDPHAFSPTHSRSWTETCAAKDGKPDYTNCTDASDMRYATSTGFLDGLGAAALYAGSVAYAGNQIGRGLGKSGDTVNQEGGGAHQSQGQSQEQRQGQRQSQRGRR